MIRRCSPPFSLTTITAWLALAFTVSAPLRAAAESSAAAAQSTASDSASNAPVPPKRATTEIQGLLNLGASLTDRGDYDSAEISYRQVLNAPTVSEQDLKSGLLALAHMHRRKGELTKAIAIYERYLRDYPGDDRTPNALLDLGRALRSLGVYKLAIARFYSVINSTLKLPGEGFDRYQVLAKTAQFEIAETHFQAGEFVEANKFYTRLRLLDLAPADRARAHFKAGYALRLHGDFEGSIMSLRAYIEQWPQDENVPEARYLLAITLRELKRPQEAFAATLDLLRTEKSRIASDPKRWAYWQRKTGNQLANDFFETGDTMNARAIYAGLLELSPEPAWRFPITYQLGLCYERLGASDNARASYQAIVDAAGSNPNADLLELATMAKWRIEHLEWSEGISRQISKVFDSTGRKSATTSIPTPALQKTAATP
jgi:tetratricopeptide (TPR) repeat protein